LPLGAFAAFLSFGIKIAAVKGIGHKPGTEGGSG